jgi:serine/threonine-protein kinase
MASSENTEARLKAALADRYRIEREIGSGGMATVHLAEDVKHDRRVAVKVLKPELAAVVGTERFLAEIRTTANLSHPHILPLHDSGVADGFLFYVMPYVEGESLRTRLDREGQLPVEEAVRIAGHVADALESAHRHGVIHRDIKPGNILFQEGQPVVSDFGIALAVTSAGGGRLTETGLSLGTPYYMSPEQAAGDQTPTAASDVYSLGCVLYEMLTGEPPHTGASAQAILGKILLADVIRPTKLRRTIPANVEGTVLKALERLPADRFGSIGELAAALNDKGFRHAIGQEIGTAARPWKAAAIGSSILVLLALAVAVLGALRPEAPPPVTYLRLYPPGVGIATRDLARYFALAPDGSSMVYPNTVGLESGWQLWVKERGAEAGTPLAGTNNAIDVAYSPDSQWIVYRVGTDLLKRPLRGGGVVPLLEGVTNSMMALDWLADGTIICEMWPYTTLVRIPEAGGAPSDTVLDARSLPLWVHGLPGSEAALIGTCPWAGCGSGSVLEVLDLRADTSWTIQEEALRAWYVDTGHVVWVRRDGAVFATPFDLGSLAWSGDHQLLFEGVLTTQTVANMVLAGDGTVVVVKGSLPRDEYEAVWVDRQGSEEIVAGLEPGRLSFLRLSPDGTQLAGQVTTDDYAEVWVAELERGSVWRLTSEGGGRPVWTPDGRSVTFTSIRGGTSDIWIKRADGVGDAELLVDEEFALSEASWSADSRWLLYRTDDSDLPGRGDIFARQVTGGDAGPVPLLTTPFRELTPALSPDGRFLAYTSNESGVNHVYVRPFPNVGDWREQISIGRGQEPVWARDGRELFYRKGGSGDLVAVDVEATETFQIGEEHVLFPAGAYRSNDLHQQYDVAPDGQRFVMLKPREEVEQLPEPVMIMIQNFFTELEERVGGEG